MNMEKYHANQLKDIKSLVYLQVQMYFAFKISSSELKLAVSSEKLIFSPFNWLCIAFVSKYSTFPLHKKMHWALTA